VAKGDQRGELIAVVGMSLDRALGRFDCGRGMAVIV
jgi:hypothetical protein